MSDKFIVIFAGPVGSSKSPIASFLSYSFNLPIFRTDDIRSEVNENFLHPDEEEFQKRRKERLHELILKGGSFILDASMDREWKNYKDLIAREGYRVFTISMDLSKDFLLKLLETKGYNESLKNIDRLLDEHNEFLSEYKEIVNLQITDESFKDRLELSKKELKKWLS